jgi:acetyl esterase/lipase
MLDEVNRESFMIRLFCAAILFSTTCYAAEPKHDEGRHDSNRIALWDGHAPVGGDKYANEDAWITIHRPKNPNGTAIVICPGGGYRMKMIGPEGHGIAKWLNRHGITGVVLDYRLPEGRAFVPLLDAQRAIRTVRAHAKEWELDPSRIGIIGFSAGGHLASTAATHFDDCHTNASDPIDRVNCRPDFAILIYPVITMGEHITHSGSQHNLLGGNPSPDFIKLFSNEKQITPRTPPTFLAHARNDKAVPPENSKAFYKALRANKVPAEYLELSTGGHGLNGYKGPMWDQWQRESLRWLAEMNLIPR